jgi:sulfate adenylyltransferase subunit 1
MSWYEGATLLETLENLDVSNHVDAVPFRFPVQMVNRPQTPEWPDYRGFMGRIASGTVKVGDEVTVLPSGKSSRVKEIVTFDANLEEAFAPMSTTLTLDDEIDISRGDMLVHTGETPQDANTVEAMLCWMGEEPLSPRKKYHIKHTTNTVKAMVTEIVYRTDIHTLEREEGADELAMNDIGRVAFKLQKPMFYDAYADNHGTGSFIIIDSFTNNTVGAGMICAA